MARYESQQVFDFDNSQGDRAIVPDAGASVAVEFWNGATWTPDANSPVISPTAIYTKGCRVRITPTGGGYFIEGGIVV